MSWQYFPLSCLCSTLLDSLSGNTEPILYTTLIVEIQQSQS